MSGIDTQHKPTFDTSSIHDDIKTIRNNVSILKEDLRVKNQELLDFHNMQRERGDIIIGNWELWNEKRNIELQIQWLEEILSHVENNFNRETNYIQNSTLEDLSRLADLEMIPNWVSTKQYQDLQKYKNYREIRAAKLNLNRLNDIRDDHLEDTVNEESWFGNKRARTLRDVVELGIIPSSKYSTLTRKWKEVVDRWLDLIAAQYLDENFEEFIREKRKKRSKWNPDEIKTWEVKSHFNRKEFMEVWFDMTSEEFISLKDRAFQDADNEILEVFSTYPLSVKLQWRTTLVQSMRNRERKPNNNEHIVVKWEGLWMIVFNLTDNPPVAQKVLSTRISKLVNLPIIKEWDLISKKGDIFTINRLWEEIYRFKVWPNNGNVMVA